MPSRRLLLAVTCVLVVAAGAEAAPSPPLSDTLRDPWRWSHFTRASGLPSDLVTAAVSVPGDGLWAVTRGGVARFDGFMWKRVAIAGGLTDPPDILVPYGNRGVLAVAGGRLLVGTSAGLRAVTLEDGGTTLRLAGCARAASGPALLLTATGALYEWDGRSAKPHAAARELGHVHWMRQAGQRAVWVSAEAGLWCWEGTRWRLRLRGRDVLMQGVAELPDESALAYVEVPRSLRGLWEWSGESQPRPIRQIVHAMVASIAVGPTGETVIVHNTGDVMVRAGDSWVPVRGPGTGIGEARTAGFLPDGDLWIATDHGLYLHRRASTLWHAYAIPEPDDRNTVNAIVPLRNGRMLLGTAHGVVEVTTGSPWAAVPTSTSDNLGEVTGLATDAHGRVWATSGNSFTGARWRDQAGAWHTARLDPVLDTAYLHRTTTDSRGGLWFLGLSADPMRPADGSPEGPGAFRVTFSAAGTPATVERWGRAEGLLSGRVYGFAEAPDGAYWFATASGLSRWHDHRWTHWTAHEGLKAPRVFCVAVDRTGDAWFGHQTWLGVGRIHNDRVEYYTEKDGLATDSAWEIQIDQRNRPWVAGEGGVSLLRDGAWTAFGPQMGLAAHARFWPILPAGDHVYLGSRGGGLVELNLSEQVPPPPLVVAEPPAEDASGVLVRWQAFAWWGEMAPDEVPTRSRLDNGPWTPWSTERARRFENLSPGLHTVTFESKGVLGTVNGGIPPLRITVPPPLVRRPGFYVPVAFLTLLVAGLLVVLSVRQRRHHRDLHLREQQLSRTFQASPLATTVTRLDDGRILEVNQTLLAAAGRSREDLIGKTVAEAGLVAEDYGRERVVAALAAGRPAPPMTLRACSAQGETRELVAYSEIVEYGGTRAILSHMLDVTEQRRLEGQLRQAQKMESIGRLAGGVAHDFNNLLTVIIGNASLLELELPEGDPRLAGIEQIKIAGERAERLTRQLLAFARKQLVEPKVLDINDVVMGTDRMLRRLIGEDVELVTLTGPDLDHVLIDPSQIDQVIMNMAVNARDAMPNGGTLTIRTQNVTITEREAALLPEAKAGRYVRLSISDTGTGMDAATQARLFEPFFTTKEPGKGTGLGLATCYGVVRQAGGQILVESAVGCGTTFHIDLPPAPVDKRAGDFSERPAEMKGGAETILLVEDEAQVRTLAASVLRSRGYEVFEAGTGTEALQLCDGYRGHLDILVTDIVMPHMRGTELATRLRAARPGLKVLYVSGYTDDDAFRQEAGAERVAFLGKPFTPAALARKVREILDDD